MDASSDSDEPSTCSHFLASPVIAAASILHSVYAPAAPQVVVIEPHFEKYREISAQIYQISAIYAH